jgi:hypothetical protein
VKQPSRRWVIAAALLVACGVAIWLVRARSRSIDNPALLARLPRRDAIILSIDFAALRRAGLMDLLAKSKTPEEPDYREFVRKTAFDYKRDLDLALASFGAEGKYFLLRGRFDWKSLDSYARSVGGECRDAVCRMQGSAAQRKISFFPLRPQIMALAVAADPAATSRLRDPTPDARQIETSSDPLWISFPPAALKQVDSLPTGTQMFARSLEDAEDVALSLGPQGDDFQARLAVHCRTERDAVVVAQALEHTTDLLRSLIARENRTPNPRDLSGVLTAGVFTHSGSRVAGRWPISRAFITETLAGGTP